jgi:hypothetical protein
LHRGPPGLRADTPDHTRWKQIFEMKEPLAVLSPPGIAVAIAILGLIVLAFDLLHERAGGITSSTTALSALAAGATVSPTERVF